MTTASPTARQIANPVEKRWQTVMRRVTADGYCLSEAEGRFWRAWSAEHLLRLLGIPLIMAGLGQVLLDQPLLAPNTILSDEGLAFVFVIAGAFAYFVGARGFRKGLYLDAARGTLRLVSVNCRDRAMLRRQIPVDRIESVFVRRSNATGQLGSLNIRMIGQRCSFEALHGNPDELSELHYGLSRDLHAVRALAGRTTSAKAV